MHFSHLLKSSLPCSASPDGRLIATLEPPEILIWSTETLESLHAVRLPSDLSGPIQSLLWSPSSTNILISTADQIHLLPVTDLPARATIRNLVPKHAYLRFGHDDAEVLVFSAFGLKLQIFDLSSSKAVEVANPKFHQRSSASRAFSIRPRSGHMALLTRTAGKDLISIHPPGSRQLERSWAPDMIDAQALAWSPDGQWLLVWESPAHGWRLLLYSPDGQLIRALDGPRPPRQEHSLLTPGIKTCQFSPNALLWAVSDYTRSVSILDTTSWRETLELVHPSTISPSDTLQVWQEQLLESTPDQQPTRSFLRATQEVSPSTATVDGKPSAETRPGCSAIAFDAASNLVATRLDDAPSTLWIWDLSAAELRAVLLFHNPVDFSWHPKVPELLLVVCHDDPHHNASFTWDPLSQGPRPLPVDEYWPGGRADEQVHTNWVDWDSDTPALIVSDSQRGCLVLLSDAEDPPPPWYMDNTARLAFGSSNTMMLNGKAIHADDDTSALDDTFSFKHG